MKLDVYKDREGRWRWALIAGNNRIVADSGQSYASHSAAWRGFQRIAFWLEESDFIRLKNRNAK